MNKYEKQYRYVFGGEDMSHYDKYYEQEVQGHWDVDYLHPYSKKTTKPKVTIPTEMYDFTKVLEYAAELGKYEPDNWLTKDGNKCSMRDMHSSMFRHIAESYCGNRNDKDTNLDPLLHVAVRALMMYCRIQKGLIHKEDE